MDDDDADGSSEPQKRGTWGKVKEYTRAHLNFYRIHMLFFIFTPLIFSGIFSAANSDKFHVAYIDSLFNSVSAMTVCGLATVDLSGLTNFQQALLFIQMCLGSPVLISWVMVYIRRSFFSSKFSALIEASMSSRASRAMNAPVEVHILPWWKRMLKLGLASPKRSESAHRTSEPDAEMSARPPLSRLRTDMIRRMDAPPKLVNPSGSLSHLHDGDQRMPGDGPRKQPPALEQDPSKGATETHSGSDEGRGEDNGDASSLPDFSRVSSVPDPPPRFGRTASISMPRSQTVEFIDTPRPQRDPHAPTRDDGEGFTRTNTYSSAHPFAERRPTRRASTIRSLAGTDTLPRTTTYQSTRTMHRGFGGFPTPFELATSLVRRFAPGLERRLTRTVTIPRTRTIGSTRGGAEGVVPVSYISFEAVVGRNSAFQRLTHEQLEELGGVEYRALGALLWIVGGYHILSQLLSFVVIAPYMSMSKWAADFVPPQLHRYTSPVWFSAFQVVSSYTNTGMSLEDESMVPFQTAYPMIVLMAFLILAGNTAFPVFLRFVIWTVSKTVPFGSRVKETLHFLLDHPRRCFIYLFPSHQTWFLLTVLVVLNATDWFFFLVLDIGNPAVDSIPVGTRILLGLLQATAVRASGFATVTLAQLAPAVKVLYVIMMYVSVYPIAMSVRSTNVYEERSLGIFEDEDSTDDLNFNPSSGNRVTVWSRYLAMHMRKQLSFDMWWLGLALFLVCIIERDALEDTNNAVWFNIFTILFELVSAYGTVGLSLGVPYANYSFSGALRPLSKLIVCAVMIRGRHRGLPVAIDRAVMLPREFEAYISSQALGDGEADGVQSRISQDPEMAQLAKMQSRGPARKASAHEVGPEGVRELQRRASRIVDEEVDVPP